MFGLASHPNGISLPGPRWVDGQAGPPAEHTSDNNGLALRRFAPPGSATLRHMPLRGTSLTLERYALLGLRLKMVARRLFLRDSWPGRAED
jgi:hypothetical protein